MWIVPAGFLDALAGSHSFNLDVRTYLAGVELGSVQVDSGSIQVSATSRVRRRMDMMVPE